MADNYLEKKMEDYRRRPTGRRPSVVSGQGRLQIKIPTLRVFFAGEIGLPETEMIKAYSSIGSKVAFCHRDRNAGQQLAQQTGGLFIPPVSGEISWTDAFDFASDRWNGVDIVIFNNNSPTATLFGERLEGKRIISINAPLIKANQATGIGISIPENSDDMTSFVKTVLFLSAPVNHCISDQTITFR